MTDNPGTPPLTWYQRIIAAHTDVAGAAVSHFQRLKSRRYFVWQEDGANDLTANGAHTEKSVTGTTDLFTDREFDPWVDALGESLSSRGIVWTLLSVQYEPDTGLTHYEWRWGAPYGDDNI